MTPRKLTKIEPQILEIPAQKMAVVSAKGAPDKAFAELVPTLYGAVYTLKFDRKKQGFPDFKVTGLRARYANAHLVPLEEWVYSIGLAIPEDTISLTQKVPNIEVKIETWQYGTVAQILHLGPYDQEYATVARLHQFLKDNGYEIAGMHEEEYLTRPDAKVAKTLIRYPVRKMSGKTG